MTAAPPAQSGERTEEPPAAASGRGGLGARDRHLVRLVCLASSGATEALAARVREVLEREEIGLGDLLEFVLHYAVYAGWPRGSELEAIVRLQWASVHGEGSEHRATWPALESDTPLNEETTRERVRAGEEAFRTVNRVEAPCPDSPFVEAGMLAFVFGHVWRRPGLTVRERRLVAISACASAGAVHPLRHHLRSALASSDLSTADLRELIAEIDGRVPAMATAALRDGLRDGPPDRPRGPDHH
ncbi:carboxymuconolactone decarboxylase [Frankia sp. CcI49]|uniref:carboxymuconolactone decarboxylase family protein n=1 Tax=Frankia sp. CcI49 TaxID=1745382 RepID=UPI0009761809|nr:carboxymuconolactone decarboxylase family protein [Frankia sp. CcI49]ONH56256.1 carboxymuconolactone decarboxylase [Frankia sp. CcI49]